jgi:hypothetical protein
MGRKSPKWGILTTKNIMKKLITAMLGVFILSLGFAAAADKDAKLTTYTVGMSGVT